MSYRASKKQAFKELVRVLQKSEMWIVLRMDEKGTHLHTDDPDHISLLGYFFHQDHEIFEMIKELKEKLDEQAAKAS